MYSKKIAIIGGGMTGLVVGYELAKLNQKVTILEKENYLGGLASGFEIEGKVLDKTYRHIFKTDVELIALIEELGLQNKLKWYKSSTGLYWKNKMYPFLGAMDLLRFKPLGLIDKLRMGLVAIYLKYDQNWQKYEKVTAAEWMKKAVGKKAYEVVWKPLLKGKFDNYYQKISMAWLWARINTRGNSKNIKGEEVLGYLSGGFEILIERLGEIIKKNGGKINLNSEIDQLKQLEKKYDLVIDTRPAKKIDYLGAIDVIFSTKQNLSKFYWHNINDLESPFLVLIQHTNLVDKSNYNSKYIYYLGAYLPQNHRYFNWNDEKIIEKFFDYLKKILPKFDQKQIGEIKVFKFKYAQHIVSKKYEVPKYKVKDNYYQLNFAQIYPQDRGMNFAVKEAKKMVKEIIDA